MAGWVSDAVWAGLDVDAGRLSRRAERWFLRIPAISLVLIFIGLVGWQSGVVLPELEPSGTSWSRATGQKTIKQGVTVVNRGWLPIEVTGAGRDGPGLRLTTVHAAFPTTLSPGKSMDLELTYEVTDCSAVPAGPWPVPVRVERPWGTHTAYMPLPALPSPAAPASRTSTGPDPDELEWQRALADTACAAPG